MSTRRAFGTSQLPVLGDFDKHCIWTSAHELHCKLFQDYFFTECNELGGTWGQELDCGEKPVGGECGSGSNKDCHDYGHQVHIYSQDCQAVIKVL